MEQTHSKNNGQSQIPPGYALVEGGSFMMGHVTEGPEHMVKLSSFYISKFLVTQMFWQQIMPEDYSYNDEGGPNSPAENLTWYDAIKFYNKLSKMYGLTSCYSGIGEETQCDFKANGYRLPTEAEWEFAARGGNFSKGYTYAGCNNINRVAWYKGNSKDTMPIKQKLPNELGIYDMSGNVSEWCWDWFDDDYYKNSPVLNPTGPIVKVVDELGDSGRVIRGGDFMQNAVETTVFYRMYNYPETQLISVGLRLCRTVV